jgi:hypothetical protein
VCKCVGRVLQYGDSTKGVGGAVSRRCAKGKGQVIALGHMLAALTTLSLLVCVLPFVSLVFVAYRAVKRRNTEPQLRKKVKLVFERMTFVNTGCKPSLISTIRVVSVRGAPRRVAG